jgi:3-phosphoshikimate 1-carboxyvinyltransferase
VNFVVEPSTLQSGTVTVPGDKSISHRALMLGAVADGRTSISGFLNGEDCLASLAALQEMGVHIGQSSPTELVVDGVGKAGLQAPAGPLDMGNSGTAMRLFAGLLAGQSFSSQLVGDVSLSSRPMQRVVKPLSMMGAEIRTSDGKPPLIIDGRPLRGVVYSMPVASAQVKSAILLAGLYAEGEVVVHQAAVTRDHTERMLAAMGAELRAGETQIIMRGGQGLRATDIRVPADLSSAAFVILAAVISSAAEVTITNVGVNPTRTGVIEILQAMGADIRIQDVRLYGEEPVADLTVRSSSLQGIDVDPGKVSLAIDEFPVLFIAAACAEGKTRFSGIGELRVKESDRIASMAEGLRALSVTVDETEDGAVVHGGKLYGGTVNSHGDHRIAMAFAIAGTVAEWAVRIDDTAAVDTSFPGFPGIVKSLGVDIEVEQGAGADPAS